MRRRRNHARIALPAVMATGSLIAWAATGDHGGPAAAAFVTAAGALLGLLWRLAVIILLGLPGGLVPRSLRAWWRRGEEDRPAVHAWLRRAVYAADGYRCCYCRNPVGLQVDHVFPWSLGGRSVLWNLMTLCGPCNRVKSNFWAVRGRIIAYSPFQGHGSTMQAKAILRKEKQKRLSPLRIVRAAIALL